MTPARKPNEQSSPATSPSTASVSTNPERRCLPKRCWRQKPTNATSAAAAYKLEAAIAHFEYATTEGRTLRLDIGTSTGGFTDCLLQHGAARVYAYDVGHGQLDWKIRSDPRVTVREKLNARQLTPADLPEPTRLGVIDVSFISLSLILPPVARAIAASLAGAEAGGGVIVGLIKPQFELERGDVGKGGIIREPTLHVKAVEKIRMFVQEHLPGWHWTGVVDSPILGAAGNKEFLACLKN